MTAPTHLRIEHLDRPDGITERAPRLSWRLPAGTAEQEAYEIEVDGSTSGCVESAASVLVPWPGEPLRSRQTVTWRVRVWTPAGESEWSERSTFETGLLAPDDWIARWIEPFEEERAPHGNDRPSS